MMKDTFVNVLIMASTAKFFDVQIKLQTNFSVHTDQCVSVF